MTRFLFKGSVENNTVGHAGPGVLRNVHLAHAGRFRGFQLGGKLRADLHQLRGRWSGVRVRGELAGPRFCFQGPDLYKLTFFKAFFVELNFFLCYVNQVFKTLIKCFKFFTSHNAGEVLILKDFKVLKISVKLVGVEVIFSKYTKFKVCINKLSKVVL